MGPQAPHPGEVVLELGQLDLQLSLGALRVVGEDVEDHRCAIDHRDAERGLEVALLPGGQLVVAGDEIGALGGGLPLELAQLAPPEVAVRVGPLAPLDQLPSGGDTRGAQQLLELHERIAIRRLGRDADDEGALTGTRIRHPRFAHAVARLGGPAVAGSLHRYKCRLRACGSSSPAERGSSAAMSCASCVTVATRSSPFAVAPRRAPR
jgi:hypothetical protein